MSRAVMQQALEALEWADNGYKEGEPIQVSIQHAITALKQALAEPEQEPVAWMADDGTLLSDVTNPKMYTPLYAAPTPRKPLTKDEIAEASAGVLGLPHEIKVELARAVIAAYEAKNGITGDSDE